MCTRAGTIEIVSDVHLIKAGDKVGASEAALLGKLGVKPFKYGLEIVKVYDSGSLFEPAVLEITGEGCRMLCCVLFCAVKKSSWGF
jgi:large subunit ribosomal protein LP0